MKKLRYLLVTFIALLSLSGSVAAPIFIPQVTQAAAKQTIKVTYTLKKNKKTLSKKTVTVKKNSTVLTGLKKNWPVQLNKGFVTTIDHQKQNTKKKLYWTYTINGKMATKGVKSQKLKANDKVVFTLSQS